MVTGHPFPTLPSHINLMENGRTENRTVRRGCENSCVVDFCFVDCLIPFAVIYSSNESGTMVKNPIR